MPPERSLLLLCLAIFVGFLAIGLPLAVIPLYVHEQLGFGPAVAGAAVGIQFLATVLTRGYAGRIADQEGARLAMRRGLLGCSLSGLLYLLAVVLTLPPTGKLLILMLGRLSLGFGESLLVTGMLAWGIGTVGHNKAGKVMAWCGMAIYGSLALGAPLGLTIYEYANLAIIGTITVLLPALSFLLTKPIAPIAPTVGERRSFFSVIGRIWQPALGLALQGVGFASISAFVSLYFASQHWSGAGLALTCFGVAFALVRIVAGNLPDKIGGPRVALYSLSVEVCGLLLLWYASDVTLALIGAAVTGLGSSLIFPALGLVVVKQVEPQVRATALGGYAAFQDIAYGITGPLLGLLVADYGYAMIFLVAALCALTGLGLVAALYQQSRQPRP